MFNNKHTKSSIFGFYRINNQKILNNHPRIHIGVNVNNNLYRYGYIINHKLNLVPCFYLINEPITICKINKKYMSKEDIEYLTLMNY